MSYLHLYNAVTGQYISSYNVPGLPQNHPADIQAYMRKATTINAIQVEVDAHLRKEGMFGQFGFGPLPGIYCFSTIMDAPKITDELMTAIWHDIREPRAFTVTEEEANG